MRYYTYKLKLKGIIFLWFVLIINDYSLQVALSIVGRFPHLKKYSRYRLDSFEFVFLGKIISESTVANSVRCKKNNEFDTKKTLYLENYLRYPFKTFRCDFFRTNSYRKPSWNIVATDISLYLPTIVRFSGEVNKLSIFYSNKNSLYAMLNYLNYIPPPKCGVSFLSILR